MLSIFDQELAGTTVVSIGSSPLEDHFYNRCIRLRRVAGAPGLRPATGLAAARQPDLWPGAAPVTAPMPDPADEVRSGRR